VGGGKEKVRVDKERARQKRGSEDRNSVRQVRELVQNRDK